MEKSGKEGDVKWGEALSRGDTVGTELYGDE